MGNRWGNSGNSVRFYFGGSKITADGDCSHEIKRCLLLGWGDLDKYPLIDLWEAQGGRDFPAGSLGA